MTLEWESIHHGEAPIIDLHAHPALKVTLFKAVLTASFAASPAFNPLSVRTDWAKLRKGGLDVLLSAIYAPEHEIIRDCIYLRLIRFLMPFTYRKVFGRSYFEVANDMLDRIEEQVRQAGEKVARMAYSVTELERILALGPKRPVAVVHSVEGGHTLGDKLERLDALHKRGVAYLTLAHFYPNKAVNPVFPYPESVQKLGCFPYQGDLTLGLTRFGEEVIERMIELGMILDISHCTLPARRRIYEIVGTRMPLLASHVGAYSINPSPYNLQDWEVRRVAEGGGLVAVIFMNYFLMPHETLRGLDFIARTVQHLVEVGGIEHVGIGTDFDGFTDPPDDVKDASELPRVTQRLLSEGFSRDEVEKIWGGNALRLLRQGWRSPR